MPDIARSFQFSASAASNLTFHSACFDTRQTGFKASDYYICESVRLVLHDVAKAEQVTNLQKSRKFGLIIPEDYESRVCRTTCCLYLRVLFAPPFIFIRRLDAAKLDFISGTDPKFGFTG